MANATIVVKADTIGGPATSTRNPVRTVSKTESPFAISRARHAGSRHVDSILSPSHSSALCSGDQSRISLLATIWALNTLFAMLVSRRRRKLRKDAHPRRTKGWLRKQVIRIGRAKSALGPRYSVDMMVRNI